MVRTSAAAPPQGGSHCRPRPSHYPWPRGQIGPYTPSGRSSRRTEPVAPSGLPNPTHQSLRDKWRDGPPGLRRCPTPAEPEPFARTICQPRLGRCTPHTVLHTMPSRSRSAYIHIPYTTIILGACIRLRPQNLCPPKLGMHAPVSCNRPTLFGDTGLT